MYQRILIVVDPRPVGRAAIEQGTELARAQGAEAVYFCRVPKYAVLIADAPPYIAVPADDYYDEMRADAQAALAYATSLADAAGVRSCAVVGDGEDDARGIIDAARARNCDVIVVACEGRNALVRLLNGSVVPGLISASPVPVLVCRDGALPRMPGALPGTQAQAPEHRSHVQ